MRKEDTILVIDMQKVYLPGNPWACAHVNAAAQQIETLLDHVLALRDASPANASGATVITSRDAAAGTTAASSQRDAAGEQAGSSTGVDIGAPSVLLTRYIAPADEDAQGVWADYNRENRTINENPVMNEFIPAIARYVEEFPYIDKCTYSCFSNEYVRVAADRSMVHGGRIVLSGVVAECCVLSTFFEGTDAGYRFVYLTDACAGVDTESERAVQTILQGLSPLHVELMTTAEYIAEG